MIAFAWRGAFDSAEVDALHARAFGHRPTGDDWRAQVERYSLGWVCARDAGVLVGFVNVAWDGGIHAFVLDTMVADSHRRRGIGARLVELAADQARAARCEWLHVDFDAELRTFYVDRCGFTPTAAGVIALGASR